MSTTRFCNDKNKTCTKKSLEPITIKIGDKTEGNNHIGFFVKKLREDKGLSQYDLGIAIGLSDDIAQQQIDKYENSIVRVPIDIFFKIAKTLNFDVKLNVNDKTIEIVPRKDF